MKTRSFLWMGLIGLMVLSSCEDERIISQSTTVNAITVSGEDFTDGESVTRAGYTVDGTGFHFSWTQGDTVGIYPLGGDQVAFPISSGEGSQTAQFDGGAWALRSTYSYAAYYPFSSDNYKNKETSIPITYLGQVQNGNGSLDCLDRYDYQASIATKPDANGNVNIALKHLGCFVRFQLTMPVADTYSSIELKSTGTPFVTSGYVDLSSDSIHITPTTTSQTIKIDLNNTSTTTQDSVLVVYAMLAPVDLSNGEIQLTLNGTENKKYTKTFVGKNMVAGKAYSYNTTFDYQLILEREALIAIYNSVSTESQARMTGWGTGSDISSWYGITLTPDGCVETLRLFDVDFVKSLPSQIGDFKHLKELFILGSDLSGIYGLEGCYLAPEIGELSDLEYLHIQREGFIGAIPKEISKLKKLKKLNISETGINGIIPTEICGLENLEVLGLQYNPLTGTIPQEIGQLKNLRALYLHGKESNLSGTIPVELCSLEKLEELYLGAKLSGTIPHEIGNLISLKSLIINWSSITGEIPEEIGNLSNLVTLQIDDSPITGSLPHSLVNCQKLENLFIECCPITGPLPKWICDIKSLKRLSFYMTNMFGLIPKEWAQCPLLYDINLSRCPNLYGSIPEEVMEMNAFKYRWGNWVNGTNFNLIGVRIPAPDFNATSIDGVPINSAEEYENNKFTILYQWNYWCQSIVETPKLVELYNKYHDKGLNVVGWSDDDAEEYLEHPKPMRETIAEYGMPWQNFVVPAGEREGTGVFGNIINKYPGDIAGAIALVNEDGYIIWSNLYDSMDNLAKIIEDYFEGSDPTIYSSTDYSLDGAVRQLQSATEGNGINVILLGDGFTDKQIENGTYHDVMNKIKDSFFQEEPYKSYKQCFNVYEVNVVSKNEFKDNGNTTLRTWFGDDTQVGGNNSICIDYALKAIEAEIMDDAIIIVAINSTAYAGTCYMYNVAEGNYGKGLSVSYFSIGESDEQIANLVLHEAGGHGFAKLADEYAYEINGTISQEAIDANKVNEPYGWWKNIDFTSNPTKVKWSRFISDSRYANENIGCYEGGLTYWSGVWRPTEESIMSYNTGGFNAPSRYAIWYRINKLAFGNSWNGTYEDFVEYDAINRTPSAAARRAQSRRNYVEKPLPALAPPVVVSHSWREAK